MPAPYLILILLLSVCFTLATWLQPRALTWGGSRAQADNVLTILLGDGRRMFANHFFVKADVYFHSGYYPSMFDQQATNATATAMAGDKDEHDDHDEHEHEKAMDFLGKPKDWIDRFGRHFLITKHSHLEEGKEREILPWLRLSAELDPQRVETYTVAAYWLRRRLGKVKEAEEFLREGLRANPKSSEILFELGQLYDENYHNPDRARNLWEAALRKWREQEATKSKPDLTQFEVITGRLARLEEREGNLGEAVRFLEMLKTASPIPDEIQKQIDELKQKLKTSSR